MKMYVHSNTSMQIFYGSFIQNHQNWKQSKCPPTGERVNKVVHPYNGLLLSNKKELLIHATTWINLICIMLSKRTLTQKATYYMILFIWHSQKR